MTRIRAFEYKYKQARIYSINEIGFASKALEKYSPEKEVKIAPDKPFVRTYWRRTMSLLLVNSMR